MNNGGISTVNVFSSRSVAVVLLLLVVPRLGTAGEPGSHRTKRPWWQNYHTVLSHPRTKLAKSWELGAMAERSLWATGWYGAWWIQQQMEARGRGSMRAWLQRGDAQGLLPVFYYDAGEFGEFVALVHDRRMVLSQWQLCFYRGEVGHLMWFGKDGFYRDTKPLDLKNYRDFGLPAWTFPDGRRVDSVYDLARMSIDGKRDAWDYNHVRPADRIAEQLHLDQFLRQSKDPVPATVGRSLGRICSYDHSNPFLLRDFEAALRMMLVWKPAFLHFDNYFDNELLYPGQQAFGPWSLAKFRQFVHRHLDAAAWRCLGVGDPDRFDLKRYIHDKPYRSRGKRWHLHNRRWHDDPVWNLFVCSKFADSNRLFRDLYRFCKQESGRNGRTVVVAGNTNPLFPGRSLVTGAIDIAHFEHHAAVQFGPIVEPTGLPPHGRLGGVVRLGAAISRAGYCWPTVYVPKDLSGAKHQNLHKVMAMDCLANKGVLDYNFQYRDGYSPGCDASAAWADCFIKTYSAYYGKRKALSDVAVVYPGQTQLAALSVFTLDPEVCLYDYLGWTQALTEQHVQWDVLLDDRLGVEQLRPFHAVVLPSAACLSDAAIEALVAYVRDGGNVVLSGEVGMRYGLERFLWYRKSADTLQHCLATLSGNEVRGKIIACDALGKQFYMNRKAGGDRAAASRIAAVLAKCLPVAVRLVSTDAPETVGIFVYRESDSAIAVDLVNYALTVSTDLLAPTSAITITVKPPLDKCCFADGPASLADPDHRVAAKQTAAKSRPLTPWTYMSRSVSMKRNKDGTVVLTIPSFAVYCRVSLPLSGNAISSR